MTTIIGFCQGKNFIQDYNKSTANFYFISQQETKNPNSEYLFIIGAQRRNLAFKFFDGKKVECKPLKILTLKT